MTGISRRIFLRSVGGATLAGGVGAASPTGAAATDARTKAAVEQARAYVFLNPHEARFIEAAVARLIPSDEIGPGATEAGVSNYIDRQLGGAWGAGERLYRAGPWRQGTPSQGYQLPFTPAELFRHAMRALGEDVLRARGKSFDQLPPAEQDAYLTALQQGERDLGEVPSDVFFQSLLEMTMEGFFSDPVYGGNRDMVSWQMIGFPGAYASYYHLVDQHGLDFRRKPTSLAEDGQGHVHLRPDIPAGPDGRPAGTPKAPARKRS